MFIPKATDESYIMLSLQLVVQWRNFALSKIHRVNRSFVILIPSKEIYMETFKMNLKVKWNNLVWIKLSNPVQHSMC